MKDLKIRLVNPKYHRIVVFADGKEVNFSKSVFIIITMLVPIAVIGIFWLLDIGYIFFPVLIE